MSSASKEATSQTWLSFPACMGLLSPHETFTMRLVTNINKQKTWIAFLRASMLSDSRYFLCELYGDWLCSQLSHSFFTLQTCEVIAQVTHTWSSAICFAVKIPPQLSATRVSPLSSWYSYCSGTDANGSEYCNICPGRWMIWMCTC